MIPVSRTDAADARTAWSSYGSFVAVSAPGARIDTTNRGGYGRWNGASHGRQQRRGWQALGLQIGRVNAAGAVQAVKTALPTVSSPGTAGVVALMMSANPHLDPLASSTVGGMVAVDVAASDNVGVARVELRVNATTVAIDHEAPFDFSWDSTGVPNGMAT